MDYEPVQYTKSTVVLEDQLVLLKLAFVFVCRCKWVVDVATAVVFAGQLAGCLRNS